VTSTFSLLLSFQRLWSSLCCSAAICPASRPLLSNDTPEEPCRIKNKKSSQILSFEKKKKIKPISRSTSTSTSSSSRSTSSSRCSTTIVAGFVGPRRSTSSASRNNNNNNKSSAKLTRAAADKLSGIVFEPFNEVRSFFCSNLFLFFQFSEACARLTRTVLSLFPLSLSPPVSTPRSSPSSPTSPSSPRARTSPWRAPGSPRTARRRLTSRSSE
jgi:hypothetical protein